MSKADKMFLELGYVKNKYVGEIFTNFSKGKSNIIIYFNEGSKGVQIKIDGSSEKYSISLSKETLLAILAKTLELEW